MDRFRRLYKWASDLKMSKKATPRDDQPIRSPQTDGQSGWLILHRIPEPQAIYVVRSQLSSTPVRFVIDERCFDDTIIRTEKTKGTLYLADIFVWQGVPVHKTLSFQQRQDILKGFFETCYTPCPAFDWMPLKLRSSATTNIKGYEYYSEQPGDIGSFSDDTRVLRTIHRTDIPDVYSIEGESGYLNVPNLEISKKLLDMGETFQLYCEKSGDPDLWEIIAFKDKP
jgi:hypothetical protein